MGQASLREGKEQTSKVQEESSFYVPSKAARGCARACPEGGDAKPGVANTNKQSTERF